MKDVSRKFAFYTQAKGKAPVAMCAGKKEYVIKDMDIIKTILGEISVHLRVYIYFCIYCVFTLFTAFIVRNT